MAEDKKKAVLIVGGGITGITAAVEIAETGREAILVEKESYLGGNVVRMNNYFPKLCPPACGLEINFRRIRQNPRIRLYTQTEIKTLEGTKGNYKVILKQSPQYVNDLCTSCGKCADVCPVQIPNSFNYGFDQTTAIHLPHEMAFPHKYRIDQEACRMNECRACIDACAYHAIDLSAKTMEIPLEVGSVVMATGWKHYDAGRIEGLSYAQSPNVITNVEFERLIAPSGPGAGVLQRPSDQKTPLRVAFVQCAGSRDDNHLPYCSAVCCSASLKHALTLREKNPETRISIFYIDLRVFGRNEDFLNRVKDSPDISLIKGKVARIREMTPSQNLILEAEDIMEGKKISTEAELVVLATGIIPQIPGINPEISPEGFLQETQTNGIIPAGCSKKPMDVSASVKDATAAALKALQ